MFFEEKPQRTGPEDKTAQLLAEGESRPEQILFVREQGHLRGVAGGNNDVYFKHAFPAFLKILDAARPNAIIVLQ